MKTFLFLSPRYSPKWRLLFLIYHSLSHLNLRHPVQYLVIRARNCKKIANIRANEVEAGYGDESSRTS